jgi:outer membrane autotransporter protein
MGDATINSWTANGAATPIESDGKDTWFEYAIGAQFNVNKNTYVYADIERTEGATMDEDWRANVGVRFAF